MLNFSHHLTAAMTEQLSEAKDVFAMMRRKILASQIASIPTKGLKPEAIAQKEDEIKDQVENMPTTDLVHLYSQLTGVLSKEDQEQADKDAADAQAAKDAQAQAAKDAQTETGQGGDAPASAGDGGGSGS